MSLSRPCPDDEPADLRDRGGEDPIGAWPEFDTRLLDDGRGAVPPFPIDLIPQPWRDWTADRARGAGAPVDYAVQALLAAVSGVCGAGVEVQITPEWSEPLVLWQALVGGPSSGKSPVLERLRGVLATIETRIRKSQGGREGGPARIVVGNASIRAIAQSWPAIRAASCCGGTIRRPGSPSWAEAPTIAPTGGRPGRRAASPWRIAASRRCSSTASP